MPLSQECITAYSRNIRSFTRYQTSQSSGTSPSICPESIALAELVSHIENVERIDDTSHIFKLSELAKLYKDRLQQLGADTPYIHTTRLKDKLLTRIPSLEATKSNYEIVLSFKKDMGDALLFASKSDTDSDAVILMRALSDLCEKTFFKTSYKFSGFALLIEQYAKNPETLIALVQMILGGTNIRNQTDNYEDLSSAVRSLTQLLVFNSVTKSQGLQTCASQSRTRDFVTSLSGNVSPQ